MPQNDFARLHNRYLDPPYEGPECECSTEDGDELDHEECHNKDCHCSLHDKYDPKNEPEYYMD